MFTKKIAFVINFSVSWVVVWAYKLRSFFMGRVEKEWRMALFEGWVAGRRHGNGRKMGLVGSDRVN